MKKTVLFCIIILLATNALAIQVQNHLIDIELDETGFSKIVERYELKFEDILEVGSFTEQAQKNSSSILAWQADYEFFSPRFASSNNRIIRSSISIGSPTITVENSEVSAEALNTLILEYELENPLAKILKDEPREKVFSFSGKQLNYFIKEGLIVIPENTTITIKLPTNAQILGHNSPAQITVNENNIVLSGISTSRFDLQYSIAKPISTRVNSLELIQNFFSNSSNLVIIVIVLIIIAALFWKKKGISKKIENYVVEHSELEQSQIHEDVELEV